MLKRDVQFMWLAGQAIPDHKTINRIRSERFKDVLKEIFTQVVQMLAAVGHISLKDINLDGTKIKAMRTATRLYGAMPSRPIKKR